MLTRTTIAALAAMTAALGLSFGAAVAREAMLYEATSFEMAQKDNKHLVVEVFKTGCPTCKAQQPGLNEARAKFPNAEFVKVDFLGDQGPVKRFNAVKQSTIIVFKGREEVARIVGETDKDAIVGAVAKGG